MAGGVVASAATANVAAYPSRLTPYVIVVALMAASGGLLFGYDIGITGGVESMPSFQQKFFPSVYAAVVSGEAKPTSPYCQYDDEGLQFFTSSLFLAGLFMSFIAGWVTRKYGRKATMTMAGLCFLIGAALNASAQDLAMLYIGRIFLGFGIGAANQVVPLYLSEMAPAKYRGALNMCFQMSVTIGILAAQLINYGLQEVSWGWRLSLGLAAVPATIMTLGGLLLPESPNSLIERGHMKKGRAVLEKLRGTAEVDAEYDDIVVATEESKKFSTRASFRIMFTRKYSPMLITTCLIAFFQQLTGINAIMFYVPVLFQSFGNGRSTALMNTCIVGAVNVLSTLVAIFSCDKVGRRGLFLQGGTQMFVAQVTTGVLLGVEFSKYPSGILPDSVAIGALVAICIFVAGFAWSWGPLGWLVPSEIQTLETRSAGMTMAVTINFLFSFVIGQAFLSMLCAMEWGVFLFFAGWVLIMTVFVFFYVPETKGVPVERVEALFAEHPRWIKLMGKAAAAEIIEAKMSAVSSAGAMERAAAEHKAASAKNLDGTVNVQL